MSARSLNKVILIGNLTRDPELRYTPSGTAVATFSLATNREWVDSTGQKQESAEFHRIVAWNKLAEICSQILTKGRKIYVEGRLQTRNWQSQEGQERQTTEIVINEMIALGEPKNNSLSSNEEAYVPESTQTGEQTSYVPEEQVYVPEEVATKEEPVEEVKEKKVGKKEKVSAAEVADDIPF